MELHRRMVRFLLGCFILICINIVATLNGLYTLQEVDKPDQSGHTATFRMGDITD